jgi:hypothetical protein
MTLPEKFDREYFENGVEKAISLYENYRWLPEISLPMANFIKQYYKDGVILDYGCAKGFLVHALRLLNVESYGFDTSEYALMNCKPEVKDFLFNDLNKIPLIVDVIIAKDVLEHFKYEDLGETLAWTCNFSEQMLVIVPLGENNKYRIPEYGFDKTHIIKENEDWWFDKFIAAGFIVDEFYYKLDCIKRNWRHHHDNGNAIFFLRRSNEKLLSIHKHL